MAWTPAAPRAAPGLSGYGLAPSRTELRGGGGGSTSFHSRVWGRIPHLHGSEFHKPKALKSEAGRAPGERDAGIPASQDGSHS